MTKLVESAIAITRTDTLTRKEWLTYRRAGIGGSDVAAILGKSKYKSAFALWVDKTTNDEPIETRNEATDWGHDLERPIAEKFAREFESAVVELPVLLQSRLHPFMLANLDFVLVEGSLDFPAGQVTKFEGEIEDLPEIHAILEIKTTGIASRGNPEAWENGNVPVAYELQGNHYSIVTGCENVIFCALVGGRGMVVAGRVYNSPEKNMELVVSEKKFWESVEFGNAPDPDGSDSSSDALKTLYPKSVEDAAEVGEFVVSLVEQFAEAKAAADRANETVKTLRNQLQLEIGDAEAITYDGRTLATFKSTKDTTVVDTDALVEWVTENCGVDIVNQFKRPKFGYRVLRLR